MKQPKTLNIVASIVAITACILIAFGNPYGKWILLPALVIAFIPTRK
jgi:hypothetical protein